LIPVGEEVSSLSAILLDDDYYHLINDHKRDLNGISIVSEVCLIPLKAFAWLNNTERKAMGLEVKSVDITKHQNDVIRLSGLLSPDDPILLPSRIHDDLNRFLDAIETRDIDMKALGRSGTTVKDFVADLRRRYQPRS
jgi:hypothetical protein